MCIKIKKGIIVLFVLSYIAHSVYVIYSFSAKYVSDKEYKEYSLYIIEKQKQDENKVVYLAKLNEDKFLVNIYLTNKYNNKENFSQEELKKVTSFEYGDYIKVNGKIVIYEKLGNIGEFDYKKYLNSKGIYGNITTYKVEYVENKGRKIGKAIYYIRNKIASIYNDNLESNQANLLKGMIYGDTKDLDEEIKTNFQNIGISHITAVSGSNLNTLIIILGIIMYKFNKRKIYMFFQIFSIIFFCFISGLELSVLRASIMNIILIICKLRNEDISIFKLLIITFAIMIGINPIYIFNVGMVLSFLSIVGIVVFSPKIYNFFESKIKWNIKNKKLSQILCKIFSVIAITLGINVVILPISIYYFNTFSIITILSNLIIAFLSDAICMLGMFSLIFFKNPYVSDLLFYILNIMLTLLINISKILNEVAYIIHIKQPHIYILYLYYTYIGVICIMYLGKLRKKIIKNELIKFKNIVIFLLVICLSLEHILGLFFNNYIYFFNVGQGEMAVIKEKSTYIMVDSGSITNDTSYIFDNFAKNQNIDKIDAIVISHFHEDHVNGIEDILEKYKVSYLIYAYPYDMESEEYIKLKEKLDKSSTKSIVVKAEDKIQIDNVDINVVFPKSEYVQNGNNDSEKENANSLVVNINIKGKNYLFMGDSTKIAENDIVQNLKKINVSKIDLLKVAHHGSKTSTSEEYIEKISPYVAVISAKYKVYKHPSNETITTLNKYGVITYITEKVGGIKYVI